MPARAAEPIVEIEVAESGIEVVTIHQLNHTAAKPDAFRISRRTVEDLRGFGKLVHLALIVLGHVVLVRATRLARLVLGFVAALGKARSDRQQEREPGNREMANRKVAKCEMAQDCCS